MHGRISFLMPSGRLLSIILLCLPPKCSASKHHIPDVYFCQSVMRQSHHYQMATQCLHRQKAKRIYPAKTPPPSRCQQATKHSQRPMALIPFLVYLYPPTKNVIFRIPTVGIRVVFCKLLLNVSNYQMHVSYLRLTMSSVPVWRSDVQAKPTVCGEPLGQTPGVSVKITYNWEV